MWMYVFIHVTCVSGFQTIANLKTFFMELDEWIKMEDKQFRRFSYTYRNLNSRLLLTPSDIKLSVAKKKFE